MGVISWILIGLIVGSTTCYFFRGKVETFLLYICLAVFGAVSGGWVAGVLSGIEQPYAEFYLSTFLTAFLCSLLVFVIQKEAGLHRPMI